jgi:hypothetical protein
VFFDVLRVALSLLLSLPVLAGADVYKWIGPDGRVHYSDRAVGGAERVTIDENARTDVEDSPAEVNVGGADPGPYTSFEIVNPEAGATFRDPDGQVPVGILLDPQLMSGHEIRMEVDGQTIPGAVAGTQITLQGLGYGSHRLRALIFDEFEVPVSTSPFVDFHLRKPLPESGIP